jgi:hypothetical protein
MVRSILEVVLKHKLKTVNEFSIDVRAKPKQRVEIILISYLMLSLKNHYHWCEV